MNAAALLALADLGREGLAAAFTIFLRVGAALALLPAFGEALVPLRVRLALAVAFTLVLLPAVGPEAAAAFAAGPLRLLATETLAGLVLGLALRLTVMALQIAGTMAAQATSLAQLLGGAGAEPQPAIAQLLLVSGLALAVMAGLHVRVVEAFLLSYEILPPGRLPGGADLGPWAVARVGQAFALAFTLAAPFAVAALVYNLALGVINRAMPQLMVAFVGAPALTLGALALLAAAAPGILELWTGALGATLSDPFAVPP